jgi:hypothetical protein
MHPHNLELELLKEIVVRECCERHAVFERRMQLVCGVEIRVARSRSPRNDDNPRHYAANIARSAPSA